VKRFVKDWLLQARNVRERDAVGLVLTALLTFAVGVGIAGCGTERSERAADMASYSSKQAKSNVPELFTIPQDQMSHVQVITISPRQWFASCD